MNRVAMLTLTLIGTTAMISAGTARCTETKGKRRG